MALNAYAALTVNGTVLEGDTSVGTIGGVDVATGHIEVNDVRWGAASAADAAGRTGKPAALPIVLTTRTGRTTPTLYEALYRNFVVAGAVKLFEIDPSTGETLHRFTLSLGKARVTEIVSHSPDTHDPAMVARPARDVITLVAPSIRYRDEVSNIEYQHDAVAR